MFGAYGMGVPPSFLEDNLHPSDPVPSNVDPSTISYAGEFSLGPLGFFMSNPRPAVEMSDSGVAISAHAVMYAEPDESDYPGYAAVETVVIRLNTSFTPNGRFPVYSNRTLPDVNGTETRIGYDAAVCLQKYDPWIIETYNTSIVSPSTLRIVDKGYGIASPSPSGKIRGAAIASTRFLNTTGKDVAFWVAHSNGVNQIWKDNDRGSNYVPSPTVGLTMPPHATLLLTSTYSPGRFFHRRRWTRRIRRTLSGTACHHPSTGRRGQFSTIPRGVGTRRRTIVRG